MLRLLPFAAALVVALLLAPTADAKLTPRALYGGGALAPNVTPQNTDVQFTSIRVNRNAKTINFYGEWQLRCPGQTLSGPAYFVAENLRVKADGTFRGRRSLDGQGPGGSQTGSVSFDGRFGADGAVTGTGRGTLALTLTDGRRINCARSFRWRALAPALRRMPSPFAAGTTSYGTTSQTYPTMIRTARNGRTITKAALEYDVKCTKQPNPIGMFNETMPGPIRVRRDGTFRGTERFDANATFVAGTASTVDATFTGRFTKREVTGTWRIRVALRDAATGAPVDTCDSGPIRIRAER